MKKRFVALVAIAMCLALASTTFARPTTEIGKCNGTMMTAVVSQNSLANSSIARHAEVVSLRNNLVNQSNPSIANWQCAAVVQVPGGYLSCDNVAISATQYTTDATIPLRADKDMVEATNFTGHVLRRSAMIT